MQGLLKLIKQTKEYTVLGKGLNTGRGQQQVFGLTGAQRNLLIAGLAGETGSTTLIVTPGEVEAGQVCDDLSALLPRVKVKQLPVYELLPYQVLAHGKEVTASRLEVLEGLCRAEPMVVVAPVEALMRRLSPPDVFAATGLELAVGDRQDPDALGRRLLAMGYERVDLVERAGQFSVRGGIVDVFPMTREVPARLEFFDDEVDSVRLFDVETQRSEEKIERLAVYPATEMVVSESQWSLGRGAVKAEYRVQRRKLEKSGDPSALRFFDEHFGRLLDMLESEVFDPGLEIFLPYFHPRPVSLLDYLPRNAAVFVDEPQKIREVVQSIQRERAETYADLLTRGKVLPGQSAGYLDWEHLYEGLNGRRSVFFSFMPRQATFIRPHNIVNFTAKSMHSFLGHMDMLAEEIRQWRRNGNAVVLLVTGQDRGRHLLDALREEKVDVFYVSSLDREVQPGNVVISHGQLSAGFELVNARLVVITEGEIFGQRKRRRREQPREAGTRLEPFTDLKVGDYVVHVNHGIGRYRGVVPLDIGGIRKDYLLIKYAGEDKLYVPTDQVSLLQKYLGAEADSPRLSKLGGAEWNRVKSRVREAVRDMAQELLALYAARETVEGYSFGPDTVWQKEFEDAFPYEETPDQLRAIREVKRDMENRRPMDRLLCGDVGYGKTEVALRAAFKAVMEGKQVAVLVPTTILAQQHYNTFRERFANYPVQVEMLSRFRSPREQRRIIQDLKEGRADIVIGTHRLVQDDIIFKDLGLLVVDEEQRFGVAHKEKLKKLRTNVDVLTLTATPIPRTLHMSLVGVRDTSLLETPPENRFPVQTYVLEEDPVMIREAIRRELARDGQVYFVHNRVADLDNVALWLKSLVPEARIITAHGQMREEELEQIMLDFIDGAYDILVCTTIIESGLDIPNVNTLIIKEANNFGLAQLYQLRGRVGRANRLSYAYLTFRKDRVLNEVAEKRLAAIREFTEFGSGYKIAMRDLEIRGAGNLLGAEQHGHIAAVGFDLYCRLLEEAVQEARGQRVEQPVETVVELPVEAYIPDNYISDTSQKVELYRRIASLRKESEIAELEEELVDRFGDLPRPVRNLLWVSRIKVMAGRLKIKSLSRQQGLYRLVLAPNHPLTGEKLVSVGELYRNKVKFSNADEEFEIRYKFREAGRTPDEQLFELEKFLENLAG
ncbi:transcription-repair coupling factor [Desulfoscipio geothermicus]|uniref:Transcription-repair-coupling factor n=1 Tax=Desulfoscipio geothermicus DSM 3669 TaxID=1121426 RepID=A0A1I6DG65_9FIRM|nr:transcription-repair coupling factor [Desulfoscipio geothermicus]SFR04433.1 transcription-repair coupling factor (superfamily II helicase) [Desulfoscipio geothermicus DSM 3669]